MIVAMMVGMVASAAVFLTAAGMTLDEALERHAVVFVVVQAFGMTMVMVAWMRYRGHAWRRCSEMAAAMVVPAIPLICLRLLDVVGGNVCGAYCGVTLAAMVGVMLYRPAEYGWRAAHATPR
jgi:hypothetical protein